RRDAHTTERTVGTSPGALEARSSLRQAPRWVSGSAPDPWGKRSFCSASLTLLFSGSMHGHAGILLRDMPKDCHRPLRRPSGTLAGAVTYAVKDSRTLETTPSWRPQAHWSEPYAWLGEGM